MTYELSDEEKAGVLASLTVEDQKYFPIWPHPGFAEDSLMGDWKDAVAEPIEVHDFLGILDKLEEWGDEVALFATGDGDFITMPPKPLANDLRAALAEIE